MTYNIDMDIFLIEIVDADNVHMELLKSFQKKEISNPKKWNEHCFSYLMVDRILRDFYKIEDREIIFNKNKPYLKNKKKFFSISHSNDYVALCFSDNDCGIDIEKIKERDYKEIAKKMNFECYNLADFYNEWTRYEAEYKLGQKSKQFKQLMYEDYIITASTSNETEEFEVYIQNGETFPNAV